MALCYKNYTQRRLFYGRHRKRDVADRQLLRFSSGAENAEADEQVELVFGVPEKNQFNLVLDGKH